MGPGAEGSPGRLGRARSLPAVGSFGHEPGPGDADEAPERGEDDDREGEGVRRHGQARDAGQSCGCSAGYLSRRAGAAEHAQQDPPSRGLAFGLPARACAAARHSGGEGTVADFDLTRPAGFLQGLRDRGIYGGKLCFIQIAKG